MILNYPGRKGTPSHPALQRAPNVNLLLGGNGSGKSSIFKAIALGVLAPVIPSSGLKAEYFVRRTAGEGSNTAASVQNGVSSGNRVPSESAEIKVDLLLEKSDTDLPQPKTIPGQAIIIGQAVITRRGDVEEIATAHTDPPSWDGIYENNSPSFFLAAYGAGRRTERPEGYSEQNRTPRYQRVAGLFEEQVGLAPFTYAYLQLKSRGAFENARQILNALLIEENITLTEQQDGLDRPLFDNNGVLLPFNALSDGYRAFIGWVWDLLLQISRVLPYNATAYRLADLSGVVIVDEIDLFLHPAWQRRVVDQISQAFPKIQFLFSSHSPLVAGTLEAQSIYVLDSGDNGAVIEQYDENIFGLTANQILTSSYFGLSSTRAPDAPQNDLVRLALSDKEEDHQSFLRRMVKDIPQE